MNVLMIGDIFGKPGRRAVKKLLPEIIRNYQVDFVIANGENAAGGTGITHDTADELLSSGIDVLTMGNHVWDKKEVFNFIDMEKRILRPANYPPGTPGLGFNVFQAHNNLDVAVVNLSGRVFIGHLDCPFRILEDILISLKKKTQIIFVDFHAEATSEKLAMGWYLDGRVTAICGTHTHIQTADARVLPGGTAYITDLGMTGPRNSVLGVESSLVIQKFLTQMPVKFEVAGGPAQFNGVIIGLNTVTGKATGITTLFEILD
ncbi:MAG: TIGR00282 family metallophosphoesterase [Syntrophomonadaceae bacterium]|nr:TIGR00282 family metallophosphoesterase [Syntrophomonadaceae bacterium]